MGFETDRDAPCLREIEPSGMQKCYLILSDEERAKGFVRPVRLAYKHIGAAPNKYPLRDLTEEERERYAKDGYVKFEEYPESESPLTGRYWTQEQLDQIGKGCGTVTTMARELAETYARDPRFYGGTYCCGCRTHFPVGEFVWEGTDERLGT